MRENLCEDDRAQGVKGVAMRKVLVAVLVLSACGLLAQSVVSEHAAGPGFEVATIKPVAPQEKASRYITMQGNNRFVAKYYTLKLLIAAAYNLSPKVISGGPAWVDSDHFDVLALTPGDARPAVPRQMAMLQTLLTDRFKLSFHREPREFSVYALEIAKGGPKLTASTAPQGEAAALISTVYPDHIHLPAKNATMSDFASLLQRALLDRPVVDRTGLSGRYDFNLDWAPDETQFGGELPAASADAQAPPFFTAIEQQLGLHIEATHGTVDALVIDNVEPPTAN